MQLELSGTIVHGTIQTDCPVDLPDASRVTIVVKPCDESSPSEGDAEWQAFLNRCRERPSRVGRGYRNREELYDRR